MFLIFFIFPFIPIFHPLFERLNPMALVLLIVFSSFPMYTNSIFTFSFWSNFFPLIVSSPEDFKKIVFYKYYRLYIMVLFSAILSTFIIWFSVVDFYVYIVIAIFSLNVNTMLFFWMASKNISRCDLSKGVFMNFEAWGFKQLNIVYFMIFGPAFVFHILYFKLSLFHAKLIFIFISIIFFLLHRYFLTLIYKSIMRRKYKILTIFRGN